MLFLTVFSLALIVAIIITIWKKEFLYLFFPLVLFLPMYYAVDISASLPLLSVARILFIIFYFYVLFAYKKDIVANIKNFKLSLPTILLLGYFILRIVSNLYYCTTNTHSIKAVLFIIFEDFILLAVAYLVNLSSIEIIKLIRNIVYGAAVIYVFGIFESFSGFRVFDYLYTAKHSLSNEHYIRMGLMRSTVTTGVACAFGSVTLILFPLVLFMYEYTKQKRYLVIAALNVMATIHSGTRSSQMFLVFVAVIGAFIHIKKPARLKKYLLNFVIIAGAISLIILVLSLSSEKYRYYYVSSGKAILNEVGFDFDLNSNAPEGIDGYGTNQEGTVSRTREFTAIPFALSYNPLFGMGYAAFWQDRVPMIVNGKIKYGMAIDVGIVLVLVNEGICGLLGYISLFVGMAILTLNKKDDRIKVHGLNPYLLLTECAFLLGSFTSIKESYKYLLFTIVFLIVANNKVDHK